MNRTINVVKCFIKAINNNKKLLESVSAARYFTKFFLYEYALSILDNKVEEDKFTKIFKPLFTKDRRVLSSSAEKKIEKLAKKTAQEAQIKVGGSIKPLLLSGGNNHNNNPFLEIQIRYTFALLILLVSVLLNMYQQNQAFQAIHELPPLHVAPFIAVMHHHDDANQNQPMNNPGIEEGLEQILDLIDTNMPAVDIPTIPHVGLRDVEAGSTDIITYEAIQDGDEMVSMNGQFGNHPITLQSFTLHTANEGVIEPVLSTYPRNPMSGVPLNQNDLRRYTAHIVPPINQMAENQNPRNPEYGSMLVSFNDPVDGGGKRRNKTRKNLRSQRRM